MNWLFRVHIIYVLPGSQLLYALLDTLYLHDFTDPSCISFTLLLFSYMDVYAVTCFTIGTNY